MTEKNKAALRLRRIPVNTVVHTPTKEEANELIAIMHENGYRSRLHGIWNMFKDKTVIFVERSLINFGTLLFYKTHKGYTILTLAEFKERYCEEEKSQPKFEVGDWVIHNHKNREVGQIEFIDYFPSGKCYYSVRFGKEYHNMGEHQLLPYTEPETKPTEDMETKELNLCELLKGHENEYFYSPYLGECKLDEIKPDEAHNQIWLRTDKEVWVALPSCGHEPDGFVMLYPSRALYEQYPLDAAKAWQVWQKQQTIFHLRIEFQPYDERGEMKCGNMGTLHFNDLKFRTPKDRDKCIEEIKSIIEKYSKK